MTTSFPLAWPAGWARTPADRRDSGSRFGRMERQYGSAGSSWIQKKPITFDYARKLLKAELERLGAENIVLSTNVPLRNDGEPRADAADRRNIDPGIAVYFLYKGKPMVMAQDAFTTLAANARSLGLAIDAMRQLERHGGGTMMERAFTGFVAIAPPNWKKPWREVFGVDPSWRGDINALFRQKAKERHSDIGGSDDLMAELNVAFKEAKQELR